MIKHILLSLVLCFAFISPVQADSAGASKFAEDTANQAVTVMKAGGSKQAVLSKLETLFVQAVNTDWIGRFVVGKHWRAMTEPQQKEYLANYKKFLVKHYTSNFQEYTEGTTFEITDSREVKSGQYLVKMNIIRPNNAQPIVVDYRVKDKDGSYSIIDIIVEGVSLLNTQRSEFSAVIQREGVDGLISQLKSKS